MGSVTALLKDLESRTIAQEVERKHLEARMQFRCPTSTVQNIDEFYDVIASYYIFHMKHCSTGGGTYNFVEAKNKAKTIVENEARRSNGDIITAYNNAHDGTQGGLGAVLDLISEGLKYEAVESYVEDVFDQHVAANQWEEKVQIISQFIAKVGSSLPENIRSGDPKRFASNYKQIIHEYAEAIRRVASSLDRY